MSISFDTVRQIALLARIGVPEERVPALAQELSSILEHEAVINQVDISGLISEDAEMGAPLRPDHGPPIPMATSPNHFAPEMRGGFFLVPRLATHEDAAEETE